MIHRSFFEKGWRNRHPFLLLFLIASCAQPRRPAPIAAPAAQTLSSACSSSDPRSSRFRADPVESGLPVRGQWRDGFDVADMNGDGFLDVVHGPPRKGNFTPAIFLGDGRGHFSLWKTAHYPPRPLDYGDTKAGDFNGDGMMDFAVSSHLLGLTVLISEGNGFYAPWSSGLESTPKTPTEPRGFSSRSIAVTDWNHDGKPDLLALNEGISRMAVRAPSMTAADQPPPPPDGVVLFFNRDGEWERMIPNQPLSVFGTSLAAGDINGDRYADALVGSSISGMRRLVLLGRRGSWTTHVIQSTPENASVTAVALNDFDRDARDELILGMRFPDSSDHCSALDVVKWSLTNETPHRLWSERSQDSIVAAAIADLDRDLLDDLIVLRNEGSIMIFARTPDGFTRDLTIQRPDWLAGCNGYDLHVADIDGDERSEIIVSYAGERTMAGTRCESGGGFAVWRVLPSR